MNQIKFSPNSLLIELYVYVYPFLILIITTCEIKIEWNGSN